MDQEQGQRLRTDWAREWESEFRDPPPPPRTGGPDLAPLFAIVDALRRGLPREVQGQFNSLLREFLLTLRALIDWYLDRLDRGERKPEVEEIRID
jgi:hypothetical protein